MENTRKRGATIHSGERDIIRRVIASCDKVLTVPLAKATERAANYCKVSSITIKRIRKEGKLTPADEKLKTPGKKRQKADQYKIKLDAFDRRVIVDVIRDFYTVNKIVPTCKKLLPVLNKKINFVWSEWSLRRELKHMGFRWKKCGSKRKILIERPDIVNWRFEYLRKIKNYRLNNNKIFYLDETWIDSNLTFQRCWQSPEVDGVLADMYASNRVIVVDIGSQDGFLYKANCSTGDYHGQMNGVNFERWIKERVIPNLPDDSVVVIDNAPYHGEQVDKVPSKRATKRVMVDWLQRHGETHEEKTTRKAVLYEAIQRLKPPGKIYKIDNLLKEKGHTVLRLPPYMCVLNAIEFVWAQVKHCVRDNNATGSASLTELTRLATKGLDSSVTPEMWKKYCDHVQHIEEEYWVKDGVMENAVDELIIRLGDEDDDSSSSSDSDSSDADSDPDAEPDDADLAVPLPMLIN